MISKEKLMTIAVLVSLLGTASLYIYTASRDTVSAGLSEIDHRLVGTKVETNGVISSVRKLSSSYLINIMEHGYDGGLDLFVEGNVVNGLDEPAELIPGARVWVRGILEDYEGSLSLRVSVPGELVVTENAYTSFLEIGRLLDNPDWHSGMELKVRGRVVRVEDSYNGIFFEISSLDGGFNILGCEFVNSTRIDIMPGDNVVFKGVFSYDNFTGRYIIRGSEPPELKIAYTSSNSDL